MSHQAFPPLTLASLEQELLNIWRQTLNIEELSPQDKFTDKGGTPELGGILIEALEKRFNLILHLPWLVTAPTVEQQARWLLYRCFPGPPPSQLAIPQEWRDIFAQHFPVRIEVAPGPPLSKMIFILCAARTGSTLLRIMLAGHSRLFSPPELELLLFYTMQERQLGLMDGWSDFKGLEAALMDLCGLDQASALSMVKQWLAENHTTYSVYQQLQKLCRPRVLVDKAPSYSLSQTALRRAETWFEQPLYIHLVRHPLACIRSWAATNFDQVVYGHPHQVGEMDWLISNENILQHLSQVDAQRQIQLRYEDLVQDPAAEMRRLCSFLKLDFEESLLQPYSGQRMTQRLSGLVSGDKGFYRKSTIDAKALEGAKRLPQDQAITTETQALAATLGYDNL